MSRLWLKLVSLRARLVLLAGVLVASAIGIPADEARADIGSVRSTLRIPASAQLPVARETRIGLNKTLLVELPVDAKDVVVSKPSIVDAIVVTPRRFYLMGKEPGDANVFFVGRDGERILLLDVVVARDLSELHAILNRLIPGSRIKLEQVGDSIVLSGTVANAADASRAGEIAAKFGKGSFVNMLRVGAKEQVLLKVSVTEMQRDALRRLGVNLPEALVKAGSFSFAKVIQNAFPITGGAAAPVGFVGPGEVPGVAAGTALQGSWKWDNSTVSALIQSLERVGLARTLAEPNLTAISGETAKFLAGGEFPIPVAVSRDTIAIQWKEFGVNVSFTPHVIAEGRISLKVLAEVSELTAEGAVTSLSLNIPGLKVRRAETTVELPSGGALAIAGLLSDETRQSAEGVPELRNLPVLGQLFRSKDFRKRETELVVIVTPLVVNPVEAARLSRPDEGFAPASELQGLFMGYLNRVYGKPGHQPAGRYQGEFGFIVEYPEEGEPG